MKTPGAEARRFTILLLILTLTIATGCGGGAGQLTRSSARRMIEESVRFKTPLTAALKDDRKFKLYPDSPDESEQSVRARILQIHLESNLTVTVLRQLGYVEVNVSVVEPPMQVIKGASDMTPWVFKIEPTLTEKGRVLARSEGVSGDKAVPLARRELVEVKGLREQSGRAVADFTWKLVPNEAGRAFDPSSETFKRLPPEMQAALEKGRGVGPFSRAATRDWSPVYKSAAGFQKYDDGWRLMAISDDPF